jgi:hypothetical protein
MVVPNLTWKPGRVAAKVSDHRCPAVMCRLSAGQPRGGWLGANTRGAALTVAGLYDDVAQIRKAACTVLLTIAREEIPAPADYMTVQDKLIPPLLSALDDDYEVRGGRALGGGTGGGGGGGSACTCVFPHRKRALFERVLKHRVGTRARLHSRDDMYHVYDMYHVISYT